MTIPEKEPPAEFQVWDPEKRKNGMAQHWGWKIRIQSQGKESKEKGIGGTKMKR